MLLARLNHRLATLIRVVALVLISWSVLHSRHHPSGSGRGLVALICFVACVVAWLVWTIRPNRDRVTPEVYVLTVAGGVLAGAAPDSAASAFTFVAVASAGVRVELARAFVVVALGALALAAAVLA